MTAKLHLFKLEQNSIFYIFEIMEKHTTNYKNTLIEIAEDCKADQGTIPTQKGDKKSIANYQYEMISANPYKFTSDKILFNIYVERKDFTQTEINDEKIKFFSKGQPCLRTSPLAKSYGWGIHHNSENKVAIWGCQTQKYEVLKKDNNINKVKAMKSKK